MPAETISDRTWQGQQSWNREVIERVGGDTFRFRVNVDAYRFQSEGVAWRWDGEAWQRVHRIPGERLRTYDRVSYVDRDVAPGAFYTDLEELRRVAFAVAGVTAA